MKYALIFLSASLFLAGCTNQTGPQLEVVATPSSQTSSLSSPASEPNKMTETDSTSPDLDTTDLFGAETEIETGL